MSAPIHSIPIEVFLDYLLPQIPITDLCNLACTDRFFASLCADDMFWKRKLKDDLNYSIVDARDKGFKLLYRGIRRPHVYVWGQKDQGRLGISNVDEIYKAHGEGIPFPVELPMKDTRIVSIVAGGWSFAALDEEGQLHVWGMRIASRNNWGDFGESGHRQSTPATLILPEPIASISSGRRHLLALDQKHQVWLLASWGRPALLRSPQINDTSSRLSRVIQVAAGWNHIALLTEAGSVFVEWPFDGELGDKVTSHHETLAQAEGRGKDTTLKEGESALKCAAWELDHPLIELPPVPAQGLPVLAKPVGVDDDVPREELKIIKIAAGEHFVIALTNQGHVLKLAAQPERGGDTTQLKEDIKYGRLTWQYLRHFSELEDVQNAFREKGLEPPTSISATFKTFTAYSVGETSVVLLGTGLDTTTPTIIPGLQNRNIVSVVLGDYHYGALTQDGVMLTWGKHSNGALGLGDPLKLPAGSPGGFAEPVEPNPTPAMEGGMHHVPIIRRRRAVPDVAEPTVVRFDHEDGKNDKFVFAITASGWHTAALVIDLDP
ncbi:RCC1/BLIP-II, partial [Clavulina sp. PMI_390]